MQIPSNLFLNKLGKPALYLPACMIVWGVISAATAACHNAAGLLAVRFFLGFVEAAYFPGAYPLPCFFHPDQEDHNYLIIYFALIRMPLLPVMLVHPQGARLQDVCPV